MAINQFPQKLGIPSGNTAARPGSPVIGDTFYNGELEILEIYNGTQWVAISAPPAVPTISSVTDVGTDLAYTSGGTFTVVVAPGTGGATALQYNVVTDSGGFSANSSGTTISLTGLTPGTSFAVSANAQNNFGTTVNSSPFASVVASTKPQVPTIGTATASGSVNEVTVTWTLGSNGGKALSAITITPYLNGTTAQTSRTAATTSSTSYTFTDGQLTGNSSYTFKVKTTNANGDSPESSATNSATMPNLVGVDFLVVAGGASGGADVAGGGGAGGLRSSVTATGGGGSLESTLFITKSTNYTVTVGGGGAAPTVNGQMGNAGANSVFSTITSTGGGAGGSTDASGGTGGSGGGAGRGGSGGARTSSPVQGFAGGSGSGASNALDSGGAGGGSGGAGTAGSATNGVGGGTGGAATNISITGSSVAYAGGGGGGAYQNTAGPVGSPSGGATAGGNEFGTSASAATANTGSGGGGGGNSGGKGGAGGSGVVILRWLTASGSITVGAGLTADSTGTDGSYSYKRFTAGSGNVSFA
jgi:hypothetical protein